MSADEIRALAKRYVQEERYHADAIEVAGFVAWVYTLEGRNVDAVDVMEELES